MNYEQLQIGKHYSFHCRRECAAVEYTGTCTEALWADKVPNKLPNPSQYRIHYYFKILAANFSRIRDVIDFTDEDVSSYIYDIEDLNYITSIDEL